MGHVTTALAEGDREATQLDESVPRWGRRFQTSSLIIAALIVAAVVPFLANPYQTHLSVLVAIYALLGIGYNVSLGFAGLLSLGHNAFIGIGAYVAVLLVRDTGISTGTSLVAAVIAGAVLSLIYGVLALRLEGAGFVIVTLALGGVTELLAVNLGDVTGGPSGITEVPAMTVFGVAFDDTLAYYYLAAVLVVVALVTTAVLRNMRTGRAWAAIRENVSLASAVGINSRAYSLAAFVLSGSVVALGGALLAFYQQYVSPEVMNFSQVLLLLMIVIVGGVGSWFGPVIGAALIVLLQEYLRALDPWQYPILGAILVIIIVVKPGGLYEVVAVDLPNFWSRVRGRPSRKQRGDEHEHASGIGNGGIETAGSLTGRGVPLDHGQRAPETSEVSETPHHTPEVLGPEILTVRGLCKSFGGVHAVQDVAFAVHEGEVVSLIGPNGAGKTTTFDMVSGVLPPSSGDIHFGGRQIAGLARHRIAQQGVVGSSQDSEVFGDLSVYECVQIGMHLKRQKGWRLLARGNHPGQSQQSHGQIMEVLRLAGLEHRAGVPGNALSYGEQRRLGVAVAVSANPRLLLLDEPMAGLNGVEVDDMLRILWSIRATGTTILLIDHDLKAVMRVSDRVIVLDHGKVIADGAPQSVVADPAVVACYIGEATAP